MTRAVLDTNIIVSGVIKGDSPPGRLLAALFEGRFAAVTAAVLVAEVARVLAYPKIRRRYHVTADAAERIVTSLALFSDPIELPSIAWRASRDPADDLFLACAIGGHAHYVVTGDHDLLVLKTFREVRLVTADAFLKTLR